MSIALPPIELPPAARRLRNEVRDFIAREKPPGTIYSDSSPEFSRKLGEHGWIGMTWPRRWGGHERSALERHVVTEELLAAGAPMFFHWVADRQSGPLIIKFGTDEQRARFLPKMARGECSFAIGLSEPDAGSDLANAKVRATRTDDGWRLSGTKLWTSNAHVADYLIVFCRSASPGADRRAGFTQLIVDLRSPGITINPVLNLERRREFNEVVFDDVAVPAGNQLGVPDQAWRQLISELAFERSGADRFLAVFWLYQALVDEVGPNPDAADAALIGRTGAHLWTLRNMSQSVAGLLERGESPEVQAALVKELGTRLEQELPMRCRALRPMAPSGAGSAGGLSVNADRPAASGPESFQHAIERAQRYVPRLTIQGGTQEILRNAIARGLGLR